MPSAKRTAKVQAAIDQSAGALSEVRRNARLRAAWHTHLDTHPQACLVSFVAGYLAAPKAQDRDSHLRMSSQLRTG